MPPVPTYSVARELLSVPYASPTSTPVMAVQAVAIEDTSIVTALADVKSGRRGDRTYTRPVCRVPGPGSRRMTVERSSAGGVP